MRIKGLRVFPVLALMCTVLCCLAGKAFADYTVTGNISYVHKDQDYRAGFLGTQTARPVRLADIEVWASNGTSPTTLLTTARVATDQSGNFSIVVPGSTQQKIQVLCYTTATATSGLTLEVRRNVNQNSAFADPTGGILSYPSPAFQYLSGTSLPIGNIQIPFTEQEFNIWDALVNAAQFLQSVTGSYPTSTILGVWSNGLSNFRSYYASPSGISTLTKKYFFIGNGYDDSMIYHQIGHFVIDAYSKLDAPDSSSAGNLPAYGDGNQDIRIAWAEGASIFLGASIRQFKGDAQAANYLVTDGTNPVLSFELQALTQPVYPGTLINSALASTKGSTNMLAVASVLWNITNGTNLQRPFSDVWSVLAAMSSSTTSGYSLEWFWDTWFTTFTTNGSPDAMKAIFSTRGIEYFADAQEPDDSALTAPAVALAQLPLASGPKVVLNEVLISSVNGIELFNAGDTTADLLGWTVVTSRSGQPDSIFTLPPFLLKPGSFVILAGTTGLNTNSVIYAATTIPWAYGFDGACEIYDASLTAKDFVRWGSSTAIPHSPWTGANPAVPAAGMSLGRSFAGNDTNSGSDWTAQVPTMGTFNLSGLEKHHTFYPVSDVDYTAFSAVSGRTYVFETLNLTNGADTVLDLLSPDGTTVLATNDDTLGFTNASRIQWKAPSSGTYIVRCSRYTGPTNLAHYGSYDLRISESVSALGLPQANILTVSNQGAGGKYSTLVSAVSAAGNGDTVQIIDSGTYAENLNIFGKSITINVATGQTPVLDGAKTAAMAIVLSNLKNIRIDRLKILHGNFGIYVSNANATIVNCVIARATTDGVYVVGSTSFATVVNSTIENNGRFGLTVVTSGTARVANSIIRDSKGGPDIQGDTVTPSLTITNSLIGTQPICNPPSPCGWNFIGRNNNPSGNPNPQFSNAALDDYRLLPASPVIDKGDPNDAALPATDAAGAPRSIAGTGTSAIPDMGAFEYYSEANLTSLEVFPQMAVGFTQGGQEYRTTLVGINAGAVPAIINVVLDDNSGFPLTVSGTTQIGIPFVIGAGGISRLETTATAPGAALVSGYVKFQSSSVLSGSALFKVLTGNSIVSEAGVGLSKPTTAFTVYVDDVNNAWSGYAIANTGSADANLTLRLRDQNGNVVAGPTILLLPHGQHIGEFAWQRFPGIDLTKFVGSVDVTSDQNVEAVALRYDNTNLDTSLQVFSTIPVLIDEVATSLYFPQAADGGGYRSNLILVNPNTAAATAKLEFFDDSGNPLAFSIGGISQTSVTVNVSAKGVARIVTDGIAPSVNVGWVKVTSSQPIGGSAIFQTVTTLNQITSEAGVASSPAASHAVSYAYSSKDAVSGQPTALSGLAICNPGSARANVTLQLRDTFGNVAAARQFVVPVNGHLAGFFSSANQWFPTGFDNFEGTLEVIADQPVSAVALRYDNLGLTVFATIPVIIVP